MAAIIAADGWMSLLGSAFEALKLQISLQSERSIIEASSPISKTQLVKITQETLRAAAKHGLVGGDEEGCEGLLDGGYVIQSRDRNLIQSLSCKSSHPASCPNMLTVYIDGLHVWRTKGQF